MGEKPQEEILVAPEYPMLEFGDGYLALIQGGIERENDDGQKVVDFMIEPSDLLKKRYNIKDSMLNQNRALPFRVLKNDLIPLNLLDEANKKWLYIKTFDHQETEISNIGWDLRKRLEEKEKQLIILQGELIWLSEQIQLAKTNPVEFITQGTEVFEKSLSKVLDLVKGKREKED